MAKGGLIEGLKKCYQGPNLLKKHLFLYVLSLITTIPILIALSQTDGSEKDMYLYLFTHPLLLILLILSSIAIGLYVTKFLNNSIKLFIWQDTQKDQERIKAMCIMPEISQDLLKNGLEVIKFGIFWIINTIIIFGITIFFLCIPVINLFFIPVAIVIFACYLYSIPYIFAGFARSYKCKGNLYPTLIFTLFPKVFLSATILGLKYFVYSICVSIIQWLLITVLMIIAGILRIGGYSIVMSLVVCIVVYFEIISILVFYYAVANIYYRKIEIEREI